MKSISDTCISALLLEKIVLYTESITCQNFGNFFNAHISVYPRLKSISLKCTSLDIKIMDVKNAALEQKLSNPNLKKIKIKDESKNCVAIQ